MCTLCYVIHAPRRGALSGNFPRGPNSSANRSHPVIVIVIVTVVVIVVVVVVVIVIVIVVLIVAVALVV